MIDTLKGRIANYKVPKRVFVVEQLPRNTMGKVQKNVLRERYKATFIPARAVDAKPSSERAAATMNANAGRNIGMLFESRGGIASTASMNPVFPFV